MYIEAKNNNHEVQMSSFSQFENMSINNSVMLRETNGRFKNDKVFEQNDDFAIVLDGVLLNFSELKEQYGNISSFEMLVALYEAKGETFMSELRGPFCGCLYDKSKNISLSFTNQIGSYGGCTAYFFENEDYFVSASDFAYIISFLKDNEVFYELSPKAIKDMLTYGYLLNTTTFAKEIKRILLGEVIVHSSDFTCNVVYYKQNNNAKIECSLDEAVELVDASFRKAVKRCFDKDLEYGYTAHWVDVSAGFDSRMTNCVAKNMGYKNITNMSHSHFASFENKWASGVSKAFNNDYVHMQLDNASYIWDVDEIVKANGGSCYCGGSTNNHLFKYINFDRFGLRHTGLMGDVIVGFRGKHFDSSPPEQLIDDFQGPMSSSCTSKRYTYSVSPFLDVEFLNVCFSLPSKYRSDYTMYARWMHLKYPEAFNLLSNTPLRHPKIISEHFFPTFPKHLLGVLKLIFHTLAYKILHLKPTLYHIKPDPYNMHAREYWYDTNANMRDFIAKYYENNIVNHKAGDEIMNDMDIMYKSDTVEDKLRVFTVLGVNKVFF